MKLRSLTTFVLILVLSIAGTIYALPQFRISGILYDKDNPTALVNGKLVKEGDTVSGVTVEKILPSGIRFRQGQKIFTVAIKTSAKSNQSKPVMAKMSKPAQVPAAKPRPGFKGSKSILALVLVLIGVITIAYRLMLTRREKDTGPGPDNKS